MKGAPPAVFDGTRTKTQQFMTEFQLWWMINSKSEVMTEAFQRIALCLSFIRGPKVDNWVAEKINQLRIAIAGDPAQGILPAHLPTDEQLWVDFGRDFLLAYQDSAAEENAYGALKNLRMDGDKIDEYIAHFEVLLAKAGWQRLDKGSIDMFFNGLTRNVKTKILSAYATLPITLNDWQSAARQVVQRYRLMDVKIGTWKPKEYKPDPRTGRNPRGQFKVKNRDPNAMDIDATTTEGKKRQVKCYYCQIEGHIKADCRKRKSDEASGKVQPVQKAKARAATIESDEEEEEAKEVPPAYDPDSLMVHIKKMKTEDRDGFLDRLLVQDHEGF